MTFEPGQKVVQAAEGSSDHPQLGARISLVEAGEEPTAGLEVRGHVCRWLQRHGCLQPFVQPDLKILEDCNLANILTRRKLERTPRLLQDLDEAVTIKDHCRPYVDPHHRSQLGAA